MFKESVLIASLKNSTALALVEWGRKAGMEQPRNAAAEMLARLAATTATETGGMAHVRH